MATMTRLLNKPLKAFGFYALIILLTSIPVYVLVVDYIWLTELDESNWLTLQHTKEKLQSREFTEADILKINQIWGELQPGVSIVKSDHEIPEDSIYEAMRPNEFDPYDSEDRFRGLKSQLKINGYLYEITIETNVEESNETLLAVAIVTISFFIILILGFILLNRNISLKSWRPFYQTLNSLKSFDLSKDQHLKLPHSDIEEFKELNKSLLNLVEKNVAAYERQKSFTENASHELQTPIALLKSKLDLLLQERGLTPQINELLSGIHAPLSRLSRINKNLVVLAKVENNQIGEPEYLKVTDQINSSFALFEDYIIAKNHSIEQKFENILNVHANPFLLETLLTNFLSNAIRHTPNGGNIKVQLKNRTLIFSNSGRNELIHKHMFERFSPTSKNQITSGLGLAIIKEIANKYGWKVAYQFENGFHIFSIEF